MFSKSLNTIAILAAAIANLSNASPVKEGVEANTGPRMAAAISSANIDALNNIGTINLTRRSNDGSFTWYNTGLGACGQVHTDADLVVALSAPLFDPYTPNSNPNYNSLCNRRLRANYNGRSVDAIVVDRCLACATYDLDLSPAAFQQLADLSVGRIQGTWDWI